MADVYTGRESYRGDQLAVELRYAGLVLDELEGLGARWRVAEESQALRLALLQPADDPGRYQGEGLTGQFTSAVEDRAGLVDRVREARRASYGDEEPPELDVVLYALRQGFRRRYDGWNGPDLGKIRLVHDVHGSPHIGGADDPRPAKADEVRIAERRPGTGAPVRVGILDTGIWDHPLLWGRCLVDSDALLPEPPPDLTAAQGHATFMAGVVLQKAPDAELVVRAALDRLGTASSWDVAKLMVSFAGKVDVLNMSFSAMTPDSERPLVLARAVELLSPQVVMVAADGNRPADPAPGRPRRNSPAWPAAFSEVIGTGADDLTGHNAEFSPDLPWISVRAAGVGVASTFPQGKVRFRRRNGEGQEEDFGEADFPEPYASWNGTSVATARVSGAIAAIADADRITAREAAAQMLSPPRYPSRAFREATSDIRVVHP